MRVQAEGGYFEKRDKAEKSVRVPRFPHPGTDGVTVVYKTERGMGDAHMHLGTQTLRNTNGRVVLRLTCISYVSLSLVEGSVLDYCCTLSSVLAGKLERMFCTLDADEGQVQSLCFEPCAQKFT